MWFQIKRTFLVQGEFIGFTHDVMYEVDYVDCTTDFHFGYEYECNYFTLKKLFCRLGLFGASQTALHICL